ncbi:MAG TPA: hypothetical protein VNL77_04455 [Roseiflexaceae bacterium]|nr:hypothetical protein [Roseiflexaceae bacterium]
MGVETARKTGVQAQAQPELPPLLSGDRLTRAEFERRYRKMPGITSER